MEEREALRRILEQEVEDADLRQRLTAMGLPPTYEHAIHLQMVQKAAAGDLSTAKYLLGLLEEPEAAPEDLADLSEVSTEMLRRMAAGEELHGAAGTG